MVVEWRDKRRESGGESDEEGQGQREDAEDERRIGAIVRVQESGHLKWTRRVETEAEVRNRDDGELLLK